MKTIKEKRKEGKFTRKRNKFTKRTISPIVLVAFFVYTIIPLPIKAAECVDWDGDGWGWDGEKGCQMSEEVTLKAPTTSNKKAEEVRDGTNLTNILPAIIPQETTKQCIDTDGDGWGWDGEKGCRVEKTNLEEKTSEVSVNNSQNNNLNPETDNSTLNNTILNLLNYANNFMTSVVSGAFASQPFNQTTLALLFNNSSYITLRKKAEEDKKNKLKDLNKARNNKLNSLKKNYQALVQKLKDSFQKKKTAFQLRKQNILNRLQQTTNRINSIQTGLEKVKFLKQKLASLLNNFNYAQSQENSHYALYLQEKKEKEHNKKKYKKYKKKYKKKHKKKYKKRYKKYKKRYKKHKKRAQNEKNSWQYFANLKRSKAREYDQVRQEIASLENQQRELSSLTRKKSALEWETDALAKLEKEQLTKEEQILNSSLTSALNSYESNQQEIDNEYINSLGIAEEEYQKELKKTGIYQEKIDAIFNDNGLIFLTKGEREEVLKQLNQKLNQEKEIVKSRIGSRYAYLANLAQEIRNAIANNAQEALEIVNQKVALAYTAFLKVKSKTKKDRHKYEDRKDIEKKAKKYAKKYKKYLKKAEKYKRKGNHKKYKKYLSKAQSKLKKYKKYSKKLAKYGGTTKHYKEGFKALEDLVKQYEKQYQQTLQEQQRARQTYTTILQQADSKQQSLLSLAQEERTREITKLDQAGVDYYQFDKIGIYPEIDLSSYFQGIATISLSGGIMGAEAGLQTAKSITKQISKISHKIKKKYRKELKKAEEEEERERLAQRRYYQQQQRIKMEEKRNADDFLKQQINQFLSFGYNPDLKQDRTVLGNTNIDSGNSSYQNIKPLILPKKFKLDSKDFNLTITPKKSWLKKIKEMGEKVKDWGKDLIFKTKDKIQDTTHSLWEKTKNAWNKTKSSFDDFKETVQEGLVNTWEKTKNIVNKGVYFVMGGVAWYNKWKKGSEDKKREEEILKRESVLPAIASEVVYEKDDKEEIVQTKEFAKIGFDKIINDTELEKYGLSSGMLEDKKSGLRARLYINKTTGQIILAFAGTNPLDSADAKADTEQALGLETRQYEQVRNISRKLQEAINNGNINKDRLIITGHSLGGGEASLVGAMIGAKTYVFNAAGLHPNTLLRAKVNLDQDFSNIVNFRTAGDLITYLQEKSEKQEIDYFLKLKNVVNENPVIKNITGALINNCYAKDLSPKAIEIINKHMDNHDKLKNILPDAIGKQVNVGNKVLNLLTNGVIDTVNIIPGTEYIDDILLKDLNSNALSVTLKSVWRGYQHTNIYHYNEN
jgi:hypothetical protein